MFSICKLCSILSQEKIFEMNRPLMMIVFDMAGTTVDENNIVYKTLQEAINTIGNFNLTLDQVLAHGAGMEKHTAIKAILKNILNIVDDQLAEDMFNYFLKQLELAYALAEVFPASNANELLAVLRAKNILSVLNTGYDRKTAESLLKKLNWKEGRDFDTLITASDVPNNRPYPDMINLAMEKLSITDPLSVVKVGDSAIDIQEGKNAGCLLNIGITTGAHSKAQLGAANPDFIIDDLLELVPIIEQLDKSKNAFATNKA